MPTTTEAGRVLYVFPVSHYCEKTRWNLDAKGLARLSDWILQGAPTPSCGK